MRLTIAATVGKTVNLLYVDVPAAEDQILLKVRFASVDRTASSELGVNLASLGALNTDRPDHHRPVQPARRGNRRERPDDGHPE